MAPGYTLTAEGLKDAPQLFAGLARDTSGLHATVTGERLAGAVSLEGEWPGRAELGLTTFLDSGCEGCLPTKYTWNGKQWRLKPITAKPLRISNAEGPITYPNGVTLWEKYVEGSSAGKTGQSTFYLDRHGKKRALRQRMRATQGCGGGTRLEGPFRGVPLSDGGLIGIGRDCQTGTISAEMWEGGATTSRIVELPGAPQGTLASHGYVTSGDTLRWRVRSPQDIVVGFGLSTSEVPSNVAYVAAFNGKNWKLLSPNQPDLGFWDVLRQPDGGLWLQLDSGPWLRRDDEATFSKDWDAVCPKLLDVDGRPPTVVFAPDGRPWLYGKDTLVEYAEGRCIGHSLPMLSTVSDACRIEAVSFFSKGELVVIRKCTTPASGVEQYLLLERPTDQSIVR
jgi:hypothetical protein